MRLFTRRNFFAGVFLGGGSLLSDMALIEPTALEIGRLDVPLGRPEGSAAVRLLQLSDFHASDCVSLDYIERAVRLGLTTEPDLICLTGDFISSRWEDWERYSRILAELPKRAPTFAILGNHDGGSWAADFCEGYEDTSLVRSMLAAAGVQLLHNTAHPLSIGLWPLTVVGLGDLWARELDLRTAYADVPEGATCILLSHNPDTKTLVAARPWKLMLSGHTHGGQCVIPGIGTPFAPVRDHNFVEGLHRWNNRFIHITRGVGNLHGLRFNCRPEVSLLTLI
jgi:predicted MPP superfamily phosphohydrolase